MALFAVMDCAAADWVYPAVQAEGPNRSLFSGAMDPDLAQATPHLVELSEGGALLSRLHAPEGRASHSGILCQSDLTLWDLRLRLRRHLQALLPDGRVVLFRFYDPRVFPVWQASLPPDALAEWFGPIHHWWIALPDRTITLSCEGGALRRTETPAPILTGA